VDDLEAVNAWVARVFFDESGDDGFPPIEAVSVAKTKVEHLVVFTPYSFVKGVEFFEVGAVWIEAAWAEKCMFVP
jgi:hypothetical protein